MAADNYSASNTKENNQSRSVELVRKFKNSLSLHIKTVKNPSAYAPMLNISVGYLNEVIKGGTGSTVSYCIQQEIYNDAKRLFYRSNADVKKIAFELGFSDYSYFVRSFRKVCGLSSLKFRSFNRK